MKNEDLGKYTIDISDEQLQKIAKAVNGDARKALTLLESVISASDEIDGRTMLKIG